MKYIVDITKTKHGGLTNYKIIEGIYEFCLENRNLPIYVLPISIIFIFAIGIYLLFAIGYEKDVEKTKLNYIDKLPYELVFIIWSVLLTIFLSIAIQCISIANYITLVFALVLYFVCYILCAIIGVTTIKRIKANEFLKSFFIYKMFKWCFNKIKKLVETFNEKQQNKEDYFGIICYL